MTEPTNIDELELFYMESYKPPKRTKREFQTKKGIIKVDGPEEPAEFKGKTKSHRFMSGNLIDREDLKQMAIRRCKELQKDIDEYDKIKVKKLFRQLSRNREQITFIFDYMKKKAKIEELMSFNNLKESDIDAEKH